jgi:two-component system cell cycle response regulator DivK
MELVKTLLISFGYEPVEASDGAIALELSKKHHFNLIYIRYTVARD